MSIFHDFRALFEALKRVQLSHMRVKLLNMTTQSLLVLIFWNNGPKNRLWPKNPMIPVKVFGSRDQLTVTETKDGYKY